MQSQARQAPRQAISHILKRFYSAPGDRSIPPAKQKYVPTEGTYPKGFRVASTHVGVKASNTRFDDLALITSDRDCKVAGVFTRNIFQAAPVTVCKELLAKGDSAYRSVLINSGCANAVTGKGGIEDAWSMCRAADEALGVSKDQSEGIDGTGKRADGKEAHPASLVMSTGVIGQRLPIDKITAQVPTVASKLGDAHEHWLSTAQAICTTDTFPKLVTREFTLPCKPEGIKFRMAGMTKGAGMIHPNMGTLLGVICTDAPVPGIDMESLLRKAVKESFNCISIDGDTSTNDTVLLFANGAATADPQPPKTPEAPTSSNEEPSDKFATGAGYYGALRDEVRDMCISLAKLVVRDGEGATKFITLRIRGARTPIIARTIAKTIAKSSLFKTAMYGQDANWGRILCAIGYSKSEHGDIIHPEDIVPENTSVSFVPATKEQEDVGLKELKLLVNGEPQQVDEALASKILKEEDLEVLVRLKPDQEVSEKEVDDEMAWKKWETDQLYWTCDFSHEYVTINGDYRT